LARDQGWQSYPYCCGEKQVGKMGLATRWLKTNFGKASKWVRSGKKVGRDGWDLDGCDKGSQDAMVYPWGYVKLMMVK